MKNIVNFCKKKYKVLIPVMVIIVLFVTLFFLYREYKYDNTRNKQEVSVFQYFSGVKVEYTSIVTYNLREAIVSVEPKNKKIEGNRVPIYYKDMSKIIFPVEMTIAFPLRNGSQYRLYQYATYSNEDGVHFIKNNTDLGNYSNFFLYDGKSVFFFPDETILKINGKEHIELDNDTVTVEGENLKVNISERYFHSFSSKVLLSTPNNLNSVFKTIDNK